MSKAGFFSLLPVHAALDLLFTHWQPTAPQEALDPRHALGRVIAAAPLSGETLPAFPRSTVDGYAVRAADTFGASATLPAYLRCVGAVTMGAVSGQALGAGEALLMHTGGMLPPNADAVVMVERTQVLQPHPLPPSPLEEGESAMGGASPRPYSPLQSSAATRRGAGGEVSFEVEIHAPVAPGENVVQVGEDVQAGAVLLPSGRRLRPVDIGGLLAAGVLRVNVTAAPRVGLLGSGDELVAPEETPALGQVRDINSALLAGLVTSAGGEPHLFGIARDDFADLLARAQAAFAACDMLVISAGSSVSTRDLTGAVIERLGKPGVLQHGLAVKPGKPTLLAVCDGKPVIGLPGNPVSAYGVARQILVPLLRRWLGLAPAPIFTCRATLSANIPSSAGREDTVPVRLHWHAGAWLAEPLFGKSNLIFTLVNADGLVTIPLDVTGYRAGESVDVVSLG